MAKKSLIAKANRKPKFSSRAYTRCRRCGRPRAYLRKFHLCRICFRELALAGQIPGVVKSSWWFVGGQLSVVSCNWRRTT